MMLTAAAEAIRGWNDDEFAAFIAGERDIVIRAPGRGSKGPKLTGEDTQLLAARVRTELAGMHTRESGLEFLESLRLNRAALRALVSALDLPLTRSDNMERLRDRIIEALIGYRLRSQAIRGATATEGQSAATSRSTAADSGHPEPRSPKQPRG
jgi:hypothetical protein